MSKKNFDKFYYIALFIYLFINMISNSIIGEQFSDLLPMFLVNAVYLILIFLKMIYTYIENDYIDLKFFIFWITGFIIACIQYFFNDYTLPLIIVIFTLGSECCSPDKIAKLHFFTVAGLLSLFTIFSQIGIMQDRITYRDGIIVRHAFGMSYTTIWAGILGFLLIEYIYLNRNNLKCKHYIVYIFLTIFCYFFTKTRINLIISLFFILVIIIYNSLSNKLDRFKKKISKLMIFSFPICAFVEYILQALYMNNPIKYNFINQLLSSRLYESAKVLSEYPITLFGNYIKMQGWGTVNFDNNLGYFYIDSFYLKYLVQYGLIFIIFISILIIFISYKLYINNDILMLFILSIVAIQGILISSIMLPYFNVFYIIALAKVSLLANNNYKIKVSNLKILNKINSVTKRKKIIQRSKIWLKLE